MKKKKSCPKLKIYIIDFVLLLFLIAIDRVTKYIAYHKLFMRPSYPVINGYLEFRYLENKGAAFGLLKNQTSFFVFVTLIVFMAILYIIVRAPYKKKFLPANICLVIIAGGAAGNFIDRLIYKHVIDFIYLSFIKFPVFNVADIFVTINTAVLVFLLIFVYKEDDLNFLKFKEKKIREIN